MRIRQIKPAFWTDTRMAELPHDARLFFVGLWCLADDDGWLRWDPAQIGAELYGFEGRRSRERRIQRMTSQIQALPGEKLVIHPCGHAQIPKLPVHQHLAGTTRRVTTYKTEHSACLPATSRDEPRLPAPVEVGLVKGGSVSVGDGQVGGTGGNGAPQPLNGPTRIGHGDYPWNKRPEESVA